LLPFSVQFRPGIPAYEQVVRAAKRAIASGRLRAGEPFPSVRAMSREFSLTPNTCQKAVTALVNAGLLEVRPGVGTVVAALPASSAAALPEALLERIDELVIEARQRGITLDTLSASLAQAWNDLEPSTEEPDE
jgi:GntR family transcriptional regulator